MAIVFLADRLGSGTEFLRIGRAIGEQIDHFDRTVAPGTSKADAAANRRVVFLSIGGAGIEHDKSQLWCLGIPLAPEPIAVFASGVKDRTHSEAALLRRTLRKTLEDV
jgi:hypothetical protein